MSRTTVIYPIITALVKAEEIIGPQRTWQAVNSPQAVFLNKFFAPCRQESLSIADIESIASFTAEDINRFLQQRGFNIQLQPFGPQEFGVASVLDLLVSWLSPGTETTVRGQDGKIYPAVRLEKAAVEGFYQAAHHGYPIVQLQTTSSDRVYMTRLDSPPADFEPLFYAEQLSDSLRPIEGYDGVVFPMVDLKQKVDIGWLIGLRTTDIRGMPARIVQALQETHLAMNQKGARARSAVALGVRLLSRIIRPDLIIDGPFLIWFQRPELRKPLFVGYITEEDWKNPGEIQGV